MIEITLNGSANEVSAFGLTQWDKGQKLKIIWNDMPESFQVHFASRNSSEAIVVKAVGGYGIAVVEIPDELLKNSADIYAWIYATDGENVGESVKRAVLYVRPRAKPHSLVEDLEMTQQEILENILGDINENIKSIKQEGTDSQYLPDYLVEETERMLAKASECQGNDSVVFIAASDAHLKNGDYNSETGLKHMGQAMRLITERYPIDFGVYLGDMTSGGSDKDIAEAKNEIMKVRSALFPNLHTMPSFVCVGSEDYLLKSYYRNGKYISQVELMNLIGKNNKNITVPEYYKNKGFFYRDLDERKVRVICLNTSETYGELLTPTSETAVMSANQLQWLCESLDLSDKSDASNWGIILLGHHPINMIDKFPLAEGVLDAYSKGTSINAATQSGDTVSYNFSGKNNARILGQFHGYLHNYKVSFITDSKIPVVCIPNASFYNNNYYSADKYTQAENIAYAEDVTYNKSVNTVNDTAFCVIVINKTSGKIDAIHYGSGVDRVIEGADVTENDPSSGGIVTPDSGTQGGESGGSNSGNGLYTNLVPTSITPSEIVYSGKGYLNGYKLNSSGDVIYGPGYTHTGHMGASYSDVIRISGGSYDGTVGNYIFVSDSNFNVLWVANLNGSDDEDSGLYYKNSGVVEFYPSLVQTGNLENMAYVLVSTVGAGENLIVTRNEKIVDVEDDNSSSGAVTNYVNILQYAADEKGNTYGTRGYKDGTKINANGKDELSAGYTASGYLVADSSAVIRTKGLTFNGEEGSCLCVYNSNFSLVKCIPLSASSDSSNGITYNGAVHTFTPANASANLGSMTYFRISGKGSGENLIITYCEEIG